ncbi:hypothetical protein [Leptolyngbya phage Lbo-JY46]
MTLLEYFNGDETAVAVWPSKYALKNHEGVIEESTPKDMHWRMAKELAEAEQKAGVEITPEIYNRLSDFGKRLPKSLSVDEIFSYLDRFRYIVPQGSIMSMLGNKYKIGSLSNCFVVPPPFDSYSGIITTDQHLAQLMKRRGGVGTNINTLRPSGSIVTNAAGTSTGAVSFMHRFSNTTREVAQNGRRGALMLLISCLHPEVFDFVKVKKDRTKVTGANISVMLTDKFMHAVAEDKDFICHFPLDYEPVYDEYFNEFLESIPYNEIVKIEQDYVSLMKIRARELFDLIVENAWENAEPGIAFIDRVRNYCPEGVYDIYVPIASNPCAEQWMQAYDACRLLALNFFSIVKNPFTSEAEIDEEKLYEVSYIQQRLADDIVDIEIEYVQRIIDKIKSDPEPENIKATELELWTNVQKTARNSRRTGCGFTALGDMLAAMGVKYDSAEGKDLIKKVCKIKMKAELDCTIDLAILRGTFTGYNVNKEFAISAEGTLSYGFNEFYNTLLQEFPEQAYRMARYGRRNVSWSTVAPTGSVSILTQTTSGLEPLFLPYYIRRKKVNPSDEGVRVDFTDQNGDNWQEFPVLHPKFKEWMIINILPGSVYTEEEFSKLTKEDIQKAFELSPWFGSTANDIDWTSRVEIQGIIQRYTTNAISSTVNLPNNVTKQEVANIYYKAWETGLKGITVYRDGCRTGVLVAETKPKVEINKFGYSDAVKRPKEIEGCLHLVTVKGDKYGVIVGLLDGNPYEVFAFKATPNMVADCGKVVKVKKGRYAYISANNTIDHLEVAATNADEQVLSRLISALLRHGVSPIFIIDQINKTPLEVVAFGKALSRVLKSYLKEEDVINKIKCDECGSTNVRLQEGCITCVDCGHSKCG